MTFTVPGWSIPLIFVGLVSGYWTIAFGIAMVIGGIVGFIRNPRGNA